VTRWLRRAVRSKGALAVVLASVVAVTLCGPGVTEVAAQERPLVVSATQAGLPPPLSISPGGAFLRALILPGWGHAAIGSYTRGGFYFGMQTATIFTLLRARVRIGESQDRVRFRESVLRAQYASEGVTDPDEVQDLLDADEGLSELDGLLDSRKGQQEDMIAFGLFMLLISSADAYVSAHLARFPEPLDLGIEPSPMGGVDLGLKIFIPN
jgi:hypothetical protein